MLYDLSVEGEFQDKYIDAVNITEGAVGKARRDSELLAWQGAMVETGTIRASRIELGSTAGVSLG